MRRSATITAKQAVCRDSVAEREEITLLDGIRRGDERSSEQLVQRYGGMLLAIARRFLRTEEDARDAVQDAFLNAFRAAPGFRGEAKLATWLRRIVLNAALMKLRAAKRRSEVPLDCRLPLFDEQGRHARIMSSFPLTTESLVLRQRGAGAGPRLYRSAAYRVAHGGDLARRGGLRHGRSGREIGNHPERGQNPAPPSSAGPAHFAGMRSGRHQPCIGPAVRSAAAHRTPTRGNRERGAPTLIPQ
jgi:hypothetical protein